MYLQVYLITFGDGLKEIGKQKNLSYNVVFSQANMWLLVFHIQWLVRYKHRNWLNLFGDVEMKTKQSSIIIIRLCISTVESYLKINCLSNHNKKRGYVESKFPFLVIILCSYIGPFRNWLITALVAPKISPSVPGIFCRINMAASVGDSRKVPAYPYVIIK